MYDYIIVGAGSAGCVLANRLSADPQNKVLLLEAGPRDTNIWTKIPAGVSRIFSNPKVNWCYTSDEEPGLNNRKLFWPRGRVLGGSSSINGHVYMRGVPDDYNNWQALGNPGWGWDDVLPYFKKSEHHFQGNSSLHGGEGELYVTPLDKAHRASAAFVAAARKAGLPPNDDFNGVRQEGVGYLQFMIKNGVRASASASFLKPVLNRPNLTLEVNAQVERLTFSGRKVTGVQYRIDGQPRAATARETILSGGTVNSPQILMLSGIGPAGHLQEMGVDVLHDLPGVGKNLQDHIYAHCLARVDPSFSINKIISSAWRLSPHILQYILSRKGLLTAGTAQVGLFTRSSPTLATPDLQIQMRPFSMLIKDGKYISEPTPAITASCTLLRPQSIGQVRLRSSDPLASPRMVANYLSDERDLKPMIYGIRLIRRVFETSPFAEHYESEALPGSQYRSDEEIVDYLRSFAQSMYHPVGTCKMGEDVNAVVDEELRVRGIEGLRVVDASVMPRIPSGNTNAPTIMIAEKAADMILQPQQSSARVQRVRPLAPAVR
ncbi:GMC family oxidoreductase N-terminal domain-containing protein [Paraburkholderia sp. 22B1P]|uniref:GMC family oxidoreductase n=1 Tax=Paraburkholderia sp. 22B1P TaxID=3080498 RepID=UPI003086F51C|nr:GMC family oxidoreductase N-terminal domain-containing protein [Paraburkholderia sp. 22B1P]